MLKLNLISPIDRDAVRAAAGYRKILFVEEGIRCGGIAEHMLCAVAENGAEAQMRIQAIESFRVGHMTVDEQFSMLGFTPRGIAGRFIKEFYEKQMTWNISRGLVIREKSKAGYGRTLVK